MLEFDLIASIIEYVKTKNSGIYFTLNTNGTLINEQNVKFLVKHIDSFAISIDGYDSFNDKTRKYFNGKGAFEDIIKGVKLLNKYNRRKIDYYQGTIQFDKSFDPEKIQNMKRYGFKRARLGINLLGLSKDEARYMAKMHFDSIINSQTKNVKITESYTSIYNSLVKKSEGIKTGYLFCNGLSRAAGKSLNLNIDRMSVNVLCSFVPSVAVQLKDIENDIYNRLIFKKSLDFIKDRYKLLKKECIDCEILMMCKGGCVMSGIDSSNNLNQSACEFNKEIWKQFLVKKGEEYEH